MSKTDFRFSAAYRNVAMAAAFGALCFGGYHFAVRFGNIDPFAKFHTPDTKFGQNFGMKLSDVDFRQYQNGRLSAAATFGGVQISKDRSSFELTGIKNGLYEGKDGQLQFAGAFGEYDTMTQRMQVSGGVRVQSADFDLQTTQAAFDHASNELSVPLIVTGKLYGGTLKAKNLKYNFKNGDASLEEARWQGKPPPQIAKSVAQGSEQSPVAKAEVVRTWDITGKDISVKGPIETFHDGTATDGEVLMFAPTIVYDRKTDIVTGTGRVTYFSGKADAIADKVVVYRKEKRAYFTGDVRMLVKPKKEEDKPGVKGEIPAPRPEATSDELKKIRDSETIATPEEKKKDDELRSGKTARDYPVRIKCEELTYWYEKGHRHAVFDGSPEASQEFSDGRWREGFAHDGAYDGEKDRMHLASETGKRQARMKNSIGDIWNGAWLDFSTKDGQTEDDEDMSGEDVSGSFADRSGEDTRKKTTPPGTTTTPPPTQTGAPPPGTGTTGTTGTGTTGTGTTGTNPPGPPVKT